MHTALDYIMPGKGVIYTTHWNDCNALLLGFADGTELQVWGERKRQQILLWKPMRSTVFYEGRDEDLRATKWLPDTTKSTLDSFLLGQTVKTCHLSTGHGNVLILEFDREMELLVWNFEKEQQIVVWERNSKILYDGRTIACKYYTAHVFADLRVRYPHIYGPSGSEPLPLFKTYSDKI